MLTEMNQCRCYSVIEDCSPDVCHQEQASVIMRPFWTLEHFTRLLVALETTGLVVIFDFDQANVAEYPF